MLECRINDHITLKLENEKTVIYVNGRRFRHCKALVLNLPREELTNLGDVKSIDELIITNEIDEVPEKQIRMYLTPEEEFWGHCSTLQAFIENNYNTNLIGGDLAFSLLAELKYSGNADVEKIFKKEIVKRLSSGFFPVILSLVKAGYTTVLNQYEYELSFMEMRKGLNNEELREVLRQDAEQTASGGFLGNFQRLEVKYSINSEELRAIKEIEHHIGRFIPYEEEYSLKGPLMYSENKKVKILRLNNIGLTYVPEAVSSLKNLESLDLRDNDIKHIPKFLTKLESLKRLLVKGNPLQKIPTSLSHLIIK